MIWRAVNRTGRSGGPAPSARGEHVPGRAGSGREDVEAITDVSRLVRLATMARLLLYEANAIEFDEAARQRLAEIHDRSVAAMSELLSDELRDELIDLQPRFSDAAAPTAAELRLAQAQLVGWLEGLFQGIRVALLTQQIASQEQLAQLYSEALHEERREEERETRAHYM